MELRDGKFVVTESEVWRARLGFESVGADSLSLKLDEATGAELVDESKKETVVNEDIARIVLAGNLALAGRLIDLRDGFRVGYAPRANALSNDVRSTVESSIEAITNYQTK